MSERQVKSKERVADHGEVFTAQREVNAMLDLVKQETERIDSRFLEPACGDGNFLEEILTGMFVFSEISLNPIPEARIFSTCAFCRLFMQIPPQGGVAEKGSKSNRLILLPKIKKVGSARKQSP